MRNSAKSSIAFYARVPVSFVVTFGTHVIKTRDFDGVIVRRTGGFQVAGVLVAIGFQVAGVLVTIGIQVAGVLVTMGIQDAGGVDVAAVVKCVSSRKK